MKCQTCGADASPMQQACEYCGAALVAGAAAQAAGTIVADSDVIAPDKTDASHYLRNAFRWLEDIGRQPSGGFNPAAFFFAIPYLWGFGARQNALRAATVIFLPLVGLDILSWLTGHRAVLALGQLVWLVRVNWLISTRADLLRSHTATYDWTQGLLALLVAGVAQAALS